MLEKVKDRVFCVRGNCDADVDLMVLPFPVMAEYAVIPVGNKLIYATHGHNLNAASLPAFPEGDILLFGHTHLPELKDVNGCMYINPGSVSLPKGGSKHSCILLNEGIFGWKDIETGNYYRHYDSLADDKPM